MRLSMEALPPLTSRKVLLILAGDGLAWLMDPRFGRGFRIPLQGTGRPFGSGVELAVFERESLEFPSPR